MMWRDDPIEEPWYELDFQMTRWQCPAGLPIELLEDVVEAIGPMDHIVLDSMKLVDRFSYGVEFLRKRYIPEAAYEIFRGEFDATEDRFVIAQNELKQRWRLVLVAHRSVISNLPKALQTQLLSPEVAYAMTYSVSEVTLEQTLKQFLSGIHPDKERYLSVE